MLKWVSTGQITTACTLHLFLLHYKCFKVYFKRTKKTRSLYMQSTILFSALVEVCTLSASCSFMVWFCSFDLDNLTAFKTYFFNGTTFNLKVRYQLTLIWLRAKMNHFHRLNICNSPLTVLFKWCSCHRFIGNSWPYLQWPALFSDIKEGENNDKKFCLLCLSPFDGLT